MLEGMKPLDGDSVAVVIVLSVNDRRTSLSNPVSDLTE